MRMRTVFAIMAAGLGFMAAFAADVAWTGGGDGVTFTDEANWGGTLPTVDDEALVTGATFGFGGGEATIGVLRLGVADGDETVLSISGGTLNVRNFRTGESATAVSHVTQSGGTFNITAGGDPGFAIGRNRRAEGVTTRDTYALSAGTLNVGSDANANIGADGYGEMTITGGEATFKGYFVIGRYGAGNGLLTMTGGKATVLRGDRHMVIGEDGYGEVDLSGTAVLDASQWVFIRNGRLTLSGNARLVTSALRERNTDRRREVVFNGGTVEAKAATTEPFMQLLESVTMGDGGVTIDVPAGVTVVIDQPILAAAGATAAGAGLTKTGAGTLVLTGANVWTGETRVAGGTLLALRGSGLPADSKLVLAGGVWAPQQAAATGPVAFEPTGTSGFTAIGTPLTVNFDNGAPLTFASDTFVAGGRNNGLVLNTAAADQPLRFENALVLNADGDSEMRVDSTNPNAVVTMAGAISRRDGDPVPAFWKYGEGTVRFEAPLTMPSTHYRTEKGLSIFGPGTGDTVMRDLICSEGGKNTIEAGSRVTATGWTYVGIGGAPSELDINGYHYANGYIRAGVNGNSQGTVNVGEGAEVNINQLYLGLNGNGTMNQTGGTVLMRGGDNRIGGCDGGNKGVGAYNLTGGQFDVRGNFQVGANWKGSYVQSELGNATATGWTSIGRFRQGTGLLDIGAGLWNQTACAVIAGEEGDGTVDVHGTGVLRTPYLRLGQYDVAHGRVHVTDGGRVETERIQSNWGQGRTGLADFAVDGGTLVARVDRRNFFDGIANVAIGPNGLTFDTADHTVGIGFADAFQGGPLTKAGSGVLQLGSTLPKVSTFTVKEGTVAFQGTKTSKGLVHRWSFNGDLTDSVGGQTGSDLGGLTFADGKMVLPGGGHNTTGVDLGADILPKEGPVTLEFWLSVDASLGWSKGISIGESTDNYIIFTGCTGGADGDTSVGMSGFMGNDTATGKADRGKEYHYAITWEPDGVSGTYVTATRRDATTGELLGIYRGYSETFRIANINQKFAYLGRTFWGDPDLGGTYNEIRVWDRALTLGEQRTSALAGPDVVPTFDATPTEDNVIAENAGDQVLKHRWSFNNGSLLDTAGGRQATTQDNSDDHVNVTVQPRSFDGVRLAGGNKGTSLIDLGSDVLPKEGPVTIELWFIVNVRRGWSQILDFGLDTGNYLVIGQALNRGGENQDKCFLSINGMFDDPGSIGVLEIGREYHAAVTLVPVEGRTEVSMTVRKAGSAEIFGSVTRKVDNWTIGGNLNQRSCWLGRSQWNDPDASVTYNELRIWHAALSDAQLEKNVKNGPDMLPQLAGVVPANGPDTLSIAAGATLDLQGTTACANNVVGSGTVQNGTLEIGGTLDPTGELTFKTSTKVTGTYIVDLEDKIVVDGDLDLTQATILVRDRQQLCGFYEIATATGTVRGPAKDHNLKGTGYSVFFSPNAVRIGSAGTVILLR